MVNSWENEKNLVPPMRSLVKNVGDDGFYIVGEDGFYIVGEVLGKVGVGRRGWG